METLNNIESNSSKYERSFSDKVLSGETHMPFPIDSIPEPIKRYCLIVAECLNVPFEYTICGALFSCSVANGAKSKFQYGPYTNYTIFWNVLLADTGKQKTPPQKQMLKPIYERDQKSIEFYEVLVNRYKSLSPEEKIKKEYPNNIQSLFNDTTGEAINLQHKYNEKTIGGLGIYSDEISRYLGGLGKYNKVPDSEKASRLERYSNGKITVNRVGDKDGRSSYSVNETTENFLGSHQPKLMNQIIDKVDIISGNFARYNWYFPEDYVKQGEPKKIPKKEEQRYSDLITSIFDCTIEELYEKDFSKKSKAYIPSVGAKIYYRKFKEECDRIHNKSKEGSMHRGIEGKTLEKASRNALLFQIIDDAKTTNASSEISEKNMKRGIELAKYHFFSSIRVAELIAVKNTIKLNRKELYRQIRDMFPNTNMSKLADALGIQRTSLYQ